MSQRVSRRGGPGAHRLNGPPKQSSQLVHILTETIHFWSLLLSQKTSPLKPDIDLTSRESTEKLISEMSAMLPKRNQHKLPMRRAQSDDDNTWNKQKSVLQTEFARLVIWKLDFDSEDIGLLLSVPTPLSTMILETILSIAELLISCKHVDCEVFPKGFC